MSSPLGSVVPSSPTLVVTRTVPGTVATSILPLNPQFSGFHVKFFSSPQKLPRSSLSLNLMSLGPLFTILKLNSV